MGHLNRGRQTHTQLSASVSRPRLSYLTRQTDASRDSARVREAPSNSSHKAPNRLPDGPWFTETMIAQQLLKAMQHTEPNAD